MSDTDELVYVVPSDYIVLGCIREHGPIHNGDIERRTGIAKERLAAYIAGRYAAAKGGWEHVHRDRIPQSNGSGGIKYAYRFDASLPARAPAERLTDRKTRVLNRTPAKREPVAAPQQRTVPVVDPKVHERVVAVVLWDENDDVVLLDGNGGLIRGRRVR